VVELGVPRLEEMGLDVAAGAGPDMTEPPLTADEADAVFAAMDDCMDIESQLADLLVDGNVAEDDAACIAEEFHASGMTRRTVLADDEHQPAAEEVDAALNDAGEACGVSGVGILPPQN
jgi:hypothetical protein